MNSQKEVAKGRILRICDYVILTFPNQVNISIKNQHGDTECDAFGGTIPEALDDCYRKGWEIGYDKTPRTKRNFKVRRVRHMRIDKFAATGWALRELWCVISEELDGRYSLSVKEYEGSVSELTIYAASVEQLHKDIYAMGYEFYMGLIYKNTTNLRVWQTLLL